ncbi:MAG: DUF2752 domain-containing protein [Verrucomicrobiae bacterium]|nr:DUF2752 domain-containing protein [Verrucomicrobiae bacterium]
MSSVEPPPLLTPPPETAQPAPAEPLPARKPARWAAALALLLAVGGLAVLYFVNPEGSRLYPKCFLYQTTGLQCPGCGGLRAGHALLHGDLAAAWRLNPLLVVLSPLLAYVVLREFMRAAFGRDWPTPFRRPWTLWALLAVLLFYMVWRNLPWFLRLTGST